MPVRVELIYVLAELKTLDDFSLDVFTLQNEATAREPVLRGSVVSRAERLVRCLLNAGLGLAFSQL